MPQFLAHLDPVLDEHGTVEWIIRATFLETVPTQHALMSNTLDSTHELFSSVFKDLKYIIR